MSTRPIASAATDLGHGRTDNDDGFVADDVHGVYAVADGTSGPGGDFACRLALQAVADAAARLSELARAARAGVKDPSYQRRLALDAIANVVQAVHTDLLGMINERKELCGAATTLSLAVWDGYGIYVAHVGDCRVYVLHERELRQLTHDHTVVAELVRMGQLRADEVATHRLRGVVSRSIGGAPTCKVELLYVDLAPGDRLLLCSDGVSDYLADDELQRVIRHGSGAEHVVAAAIDARSADNATAVVVSLPEPGVPTTAITPIAAALDHTERLDLLAGLSFCRHLRPDELMAVLRYVHEVQLLPGAVVFRQGDPGADVFLVATGKLTVEVDGQPVTSLGPGAHFGEIALVSGQPRSATVRVVEPIRLLRLGHDDFYDLSQRDQGVAVKVLWSFAQTLAGRVTDLSRQLADWKATSAPRPSDDALTQTIVVPRPGGAQRGP